MRSFTKKNSFSQTDILQCRELSVSNMTEKEQQHIVHESKSHNATQLNDHGVTATDHSTIDSQFFFIAASFVLLMFTLFVVVVVVIFLCEAYEKSNNIRMVIKNFRRKFRRCRNSRKMKWKRKKEKKTSTAHKTRHGKHLFTFTVRLVVVCKTNIAECRHRPSMWHQRCFSLSSFWLFLFTA